MKHVTMGFLTTRSVPACKALVCLLVFTVAQTSSSSSAGSDRTDASSVNSFTCNQVRELFEGGIGSPIDLHSQPEREKEESICRRGHAAGEYSCCSADTEKRLSVEAERRLKENVRHRNSPLKKRLKNVVNHYQERLRQLSEEAENRTASRLSGLHRIPWAQHRPLVAHLYQGLRTLMGITGPGASVDSNGGSASGEEGVLEDVVREFFINLFPSVFGYVLSGGEQGEERGPLTQEYHACLRRYADQIQPFGNQPDRVVRELRRSLRHARAFQRALNTLVHAMARTETASMDLTCQHALLRLQVCPDCRGVSVRTPGTKACRGLCLNVMRGCLAKMSEVSSSWDDLVVAFENLQVGMLGHYDLQKVLLYLDMNVSDAIMMAMGDSVRIYREVEVKCQDTAGRAASEEKEAAAPLPLSPVGGDDAAAPNSQEEAPRSTQVLRDFRQEMRGLVKVLEDSKGRFNRLPDWLCEEEKVFAQDMMSDTCWNGTGVGRYMEQVPEANFLSQVQRNKEVKLNLMDTDFTHFLQVKEALTHMRRDLSGLLNAEIMQGDSPQGLGSPGQGGHSSYRSSVDREGSGRSMYRKDVIVDDEDLVAYGSGSGSGSGDDGEDGGEGTSKPIETPITRKPTRPPPSSGSTVTLSAVLLSLGLSLHTLLHSLH